MGPYRLPYPVTTGARRHRVGGTVHPKCQLTGRGRRCGYLCGIRHVTAWRAWRTGSKVPHPCIMGCGCELCAFGRGIASPCPLQLSTIISLLLILSCWLPSVDLLTWACQASSPRHLAMLFTKFTSTKSPEITHHNFLMMNTMTRDMLTGSLYITPWSSYLR
jgi:hypothetical protein